MKLIERAEDLIVSRGLHFTPNIEAGDLQRCNGIQFSDVPQKVEVDRRNGSMLFLLAFISPDSRLREQLRHYLFNDYVQGAYISQLGGVYLSFPRRSKDPLYTAWHEIMHGYIDIINRNFGLLRQRTEGMSYGLDSLIGEQIVMADPMAGKTLQCFDEGIAHWGAINTGLKMGGEHAQVARKWHNKMLQGQEDVGELGMDREFILSQLVKVEESLGKKLHQQIEEDLPPSQKDNRDLSLQKAINTAGYSFVHLAMNKLTANGSSIAEALNFLINNPPTKLEQLRFPQEYIGSFKRLTLCS